MPPAPETGLAPDPRLRGWGNALATLRAQLVQGLDPQQVALAVCVGCACAFFPVLGLATPLCVGAGLLLRLNQPLIQVVNAVTSPLYLPAMWLFIRVGARVSGIPPLRLSWSLLLPELRRDPLRFAQQVGLSGYDGVLGWLLVAPAGAAMAYVALRPLLEAARRRTIRA